MYDIFIVSEVSINVSQSAEEIVIGLVHTLECTFLVTEGVSPFLVNINWNSSTVLFESSRVIISNLTNNGSLYRRTLSFLPLLGYDGREYTCYADITGFDETMSSDSLIVITKGTYNYCTHNYIQYCKATIMLLQYFIANLSINQIKTPFVFEL